MKKFTSLFFITFLVLQTSANAIEEAPAENESSEEVVVASNTMYGKIKTAYSKAPNLEVPNFEDFSRYGDTTARNCIETLSTSPNKDHFISVYLFVKHYAYRGPLFPSETIYKVIVKNNPHMEFDFDKVTNSFGGKDLISKFTDNEDNYTETRFRKSEDLLFFKKTGRKDGKKFTKYGYCYYND